MPARVVNYSTTLPTTRPGWRRVLGSTASIVLHVVVIVLILLRTQSQAARAEREAAQPHQQIQPIQLAFAPPRPTPTPRAPAPEQPPPVPITEGPDKAPGTTAPVVPRPEENPNADPNTARSEATRPNPGGDDTPAQRSAAPAPPSAIAAPTAEAQPVRTLESEAQRIFGRPSAKLGPIAGTRDNRPWESPVDMNSRGCTIPDDPADSTLPKGMAMIAGRIYNERTGEPLGGARLQILGTPYGAFADGAGYYKLYFDRTLVNRCRSQSVRVTAPGYQQRDVQLYIGATPNGDVPLSRY